MAEAREKVEELLCELREGRKPVDNSPPNESDIVLDQLNYKDLPNLRRAQAALSVKAKDKRLDVFFRARITGMVGTLNLYLDPQLSYTWHEASLIASKLQGHSISHAQNLCTWIHQYLGSKRLPVHRYGKMHALVLQDEDFSQSIQLHLQKIAKDGYIRVQDIVDFMETPEMQTKLDRIQGRKKSHCILHSVGFTQWAGVMEEGEMVCISTAMSMKMLWIIEQSLSNGGTSMRSGCIPTTMTENVTMN